jgi:hypothetical protein
MLKDRDVVNFERYLLTLNASANYNWLSDWRQAFF